MSDPIKDWPFIGKVIGALSICAALVLPMLVSAFFMGRTATEIRSQGERAVSQTLELSKRLEGVEGKLDEQSTILLRAGYENTSRFSDLERRMSTLEAARTLEPR